MISFIFEFCVENIMMHKSNFIIMNIYTVVEKANNRNKGDFHVVFTEDGI